MKDHEYIIIGDTLKWMYSYQKDNHVKARCMTNCQTLLDILRNSKIKGVEAKACICVGFNEDKNKLEFVDKHFVIHFAGKRLDPSYCVYNLKDKNYYYNYIDFITEWNMLVSINGYENFKQIAEDMNNNKFRICDTSYYNNQSDYIESLLKKFKPF